MRADRLDDEIGDLTVDQAAAVSVDELAQRRGKEHALRNARIASIELVDQSIRCEAHVHPGNAGRRADGPRHREIPNRVTRRIPRGSYPDRPHDVLDGTDDRKKKRGSARVVGTAVWSGDRDKGPYAVTGG